MSTMTLEQVRDWHRNEEEAAQWQEWPQQVKRHRNMADAIDAHLREQAKGNPRAAVPDGWKLVPIDPTDAMRAAFRGDPEALTYYTHTTLQCADFDSRYRAMVANAPHAPSQGGESSGNG